MSATKNEGRGCGILIGGLAVSIGIGVLFGAAYGWFAVGGLVIVMTIASRRYG